MFMQSGLQPWIFRLVFAVAQSDHMQFSSAQQLCRPVHANVSNPFMFLSPDHLPALLLQGRRKAQLEDSESEFEPDTEDSAEAETTAGETDADEPGPARRRLCRASGNGAAAAADAGGDDMEASGSEDDSWPEGRRTSARQVPLLDTCMLFNNRFGFPCLCSLGFSRRCSHLI